MAAPDAAPGLSTPAAEPPEVATGDIRVDGNVFGSALVTGSGNTVTVVVAADLLRMRAALGLGGRLEANPYRGLDAFDETSHRLFFGRERVVARLMQRLERATAPRVSVGGTRLLAVLGPSGCGKSSIALAGLLPALARTDSPWLRGALAVVLRPRAAPVESLADAFARAIGQDTASEARQRDFAARLRAGGPEAVRQIVGKVAPGGRTLLLVVDQFEETYTLAQPADAVQHAAGRAERDVFVAALLAAARAPGGQASVLLTLRSDFYGALAEHPALSAAVAAGSELVPAMDRDELRRAVAEPARIASGALPPHTVDRLLEQAEAGGGAALPLLSFALSRLWEAMRDGADPDETLTRLGGVGGALALRADAVLGELPKAAQDLAQAAFMATVQLGEGGRDTRRRVALDDALPADAAPAPARAALEPFVAERLLAADATPDGRVWIELAHEALIRHWGKLRGWIDAERDDLRLGRRALEAAAAWSRDGQPAGSLWGQPDLDRLRQLATQRGLPQLAATFLARSVRRERLVRQGACALAATFLVVVAGGVAAFYWGTTLTAVNAQLANARAALDATRKSLLAEQAVQRGDTMTGMLLALAAAAEPNAAGTGTARAALLDAWLSNREIATLHPSAWGLIGAAFGPNAHTVEAASTWGIMTRWDLSRGPPTEAAAHSAPAAVSAVARQFSKALSADGRRGAIGTDNGLVHEFGITTAPLVLKAQAGRASPAISLVFSDDATILASASQAGTVRAWRLKDDAASMILDTHEAANNSGMSPLLALDAGGRTVAAARRPGEVEVWQLGAAASVPTLIRVPAAVGLRFIALSPDGRRLVTITGPGQPMVWNLSSSPPTWRMLTGHDQAAVSASFSTDGTRLVTASLDRTARIWDPVHPDRPSTVLAPHGGAVIMARFSPHGDRVATTSADGTARVWDLGAPAGTEPIVLSGHDGELDDAVFSADGQHLLTTSSNDGTARVWDVSGLAPHIATLPIGSRWAGAFDPDGRHLALVAPDGTLRIRDLGASGAPVEQPIPALGFSIDRVAYSADAHHLLAWSSSGFAVWTMSGPMAKREAAPAQAGSIENMAFSRDGSRVLATSFDGRVRLWSVADLAAAPMVLDAVSGWPAGDWPMQASFSRDGHHVLTIWPGTAAWLWDVSGPRPAHSVLTTVPVSAGAFSADGTLIALGTMVGGTGVIPLTGMQSNPGESYPGDGDPIHQVSFSPDGTHLLTSSHGGNRYWSRAARQVTVLPLNSEDLGLQDAEFSPDGTRVLVASTSGTVRLWDLSAPAPAATTLVPQGSQFLRFDYTAFSPDGRRVLANGSDGLMRIFDIPPLPDLVAAAKRSLTRCLTIAQREAAGLPVTAAAGADRNAIPAPPCDEPAPTP